MELEVAVKWRNVKLYCPFPSEYILKRDSSVTGSTFPVRDPVVNEPGQAHGPRKLQFQPNGCQVQLFENFTLVQKVATTFRMVYLLALGIWAQYPIGVVLLPASGTRGFASQPDCRLDEDSYKKRADDCRECFHFIAVNTWLELTRRRQYGREDI